MSSLHYMLVALACIVGGVVTTILAPESQIDFMLAAAGAGALGKAAWDKSQEAKKERKRGDYWQEQTQSLQRPAKK